MGFFFLIVKNSQYKFLSLGFEIQKKADFFSSNVSCIVKLKKLEYLDLILTDQYCLLSNQDKVQNMRTNFKNHTFITIMIAGCTSVFWCVMGFSLRAQ